MCDEIPSPALLEFVRLRNDLSAEMQAVRDAVSMGHKSRGVKLRQPLASATVYTPLYYTLRQGWVVEILKSEWNVSSVTIRDVRDFSRNEILQVVFDQTLTPELIRAGEEAQLRREERRVNKTTAWK